jgi:hypothetical protein
VGAIKLDKEIDHLWVLPNNLLQSSAKSSMLLGSPLNRVGSPVILGGHTGNHFPVITRFAKPKDEAIDSFPGAIVVAIEADPVLVPLAG